MEIKKLYYFSIIVAALNEEKYIADCISALKGQNYRGEFDIIIVDNGSNDNTRKIAQKLGVRVIPEPQRGVSYALITGCREAKGEILAFTDADTRPRADWLSKLNGIFNSGENVAGGGGGLFYYDGPKWANILFQDFLIRFYVKYFQKRHQGLAGCNMAVRADVYKKIGGFAPGFNWGQDWQMGKRVSRLGNVIFDPDIVVNTSFRRFNGRYNSPLLKNIYAIKEFLVAGVRMLPLMYLGAKLKPQKPVR